jgi:hypothetical protein
MSAENNQHRIASDWGNSISFADKSTAQRRRVEATSLVKEAENGNLTFSHSSSRTAYRDTISANGAEIQNHYSVGGNASNSSFLSATPKQNRREGGTWKTSDGLHSALHQSNTTTRDYESTQRNIEKKVVVEKIQQPKKDQRDAVDANVVLLNGTRVRGVGYR